MIDDYHFKQMLRQFEEHSHKNHVHIEDSKNWYVMPHHTYCLITTTLIHFQGTWSHLP